MFPIATISWLAIAAEVIPVACLPRELPRQPGPDLPITSCPGYVTGNLTHTLQGLTVCYLTISRAKRPLNQN